MCPDYCIRTDKVMTKDDVVLAVGEAAGSIDNAPWQTPAAWKAVIREGKVAEWQRVNPRFKRAIIERFIGRRQRIDSHRPGYQR
jgi:hypothetical protein